MSSRAEGAGLIFMGYAYVKGNSNLDWEKDVFQIADPKDIKDGKMTDVYFVRTMEVLKAKKIDKWVKAEFIAKRFPEDYGWGVLAGIEEAIYLLRDLKINVRAMKEGTVFRASSPSWRSRVGTLNSVFMKPLFWVFSARPRVLQQKRPVVKRRQGIGR